MNHSSDIPKPNSWIAAITARWHLWAGIAISVALLLFFYRQLEPGELKTLLAEANYVYLIPAVVLYFVGVYFRTYRWQYLLAPLRRFPVHRLYPVVIVGYTANNLLPMRLGELVRSYHLARQENFSASSALGSVAVERVFDGLTLIAVVAVAVPWLLLLGAFDDTAGVSHTTAIILAVAVGAVFGGFLVFFTFLAVWPAFAAAVERFLGLLPTKLRAPALRFFRSFVSALGILSSPRKHLALVLLSLPVWLGEGSVYFLVSYSFDISSYFDSTLAYVLAIALLTATSNLATGIPSAVGGIGPFEVVAQQTLVALGVGATVAGAYSVFVHLVALWLPVNIVGLTIIVVILLRQSLSLKQLLGAPPETPVASSRHCAMASNSASASIKGEGVPP